MNYWAKRQADAQRKIADKTIEDIEKQLNVYYRNSFRKVVGEFEATYDKLLATMEDGREPTPADLYKLDKYWKMQAQLSLEMQKLGDRNIALLQKEFEKEWRSVYNEFALDSGGIFNTLSNDSAKSAINTTWLADGKNFSQRIWENTEKLVQDLNENLVHCVITGKTTTQLSRLLQERFDVSYRRANTLVRTEAAHIQTQAAAQRYKDYGLTQYIFYADTDERTCPMCADLDGKKFYYSEMEPGINAPPMHPNDRCCIIPVIDNKESENDIMNNEDKLNKIKEYYPDELKYNRSVLVEDMEKKLKNVQVLSSLTNDKHWLDQEAKLKAQIENNNKLAEDRTINSFIFCIDCGKPIHLDGRTTNAVKRCPECQAIYRRKYKAEKERERRKRKKGK